jgi:hypothetical protein
MNAPLVGIWLLFGIEIFLQLTVQWNNFAVLFFVHMQRAVFNLYYNMHGDNIVHILLLKWVQN